MSLPEDGENKPTETKLQGYAAVLSIGSTRCKANQLGKDTTFLRVDSVCGKNKRKQNTVWLTSRKET